LARKFEPGANLCVSLRYFFAHFALKQERAIFESCDHFLLFTFYFLLLLFFHF